MDVLKIGSNVITTEQLVKQVKFRGSEAVLRPMIRELVIIECARERDLSVSDEALQDRFEEIRKSRGLFTMANTEQWMKESGRTLDDLEQEAEIAELTGLLKASFSREVVEKYFAENKRNMDSAEVSAITVTDLEVANELAELLREGEEDFAAMAAEHSVDAYAKAGGYLGIRRRGDIAEAVAAAVFGEKPDGVVGPIEIEGGFVIAKLHALHPAALDEAKERDIREALLNSLIRRNWMKPEWFM